MITFIVFITFKFRCAPVNDLNRNITRNVIVYTSNGTGKLSKYMFSPFQSKIVGFSFV